MEEMFQMSNISKKTNYLTYEGSPVKNHPDYVSSTFLFRSVYQSGLPAAAKAFRGRELVLALTNSFS